MKGYVYLFLTDGMLKMITELEEYNGTHYDNIQARVDTAKVMRIMSEHIYWDYELTRTVVCNYAIKPFLKFCLYKNFICFLTIIIIFILFTHTSYYKSYIRLFWQVYLAILVYRLL